MKDYEQIKKNIAEIEEYTEDLISYIESAYCEISDNLLEEVRKVRKQLEEEKAKLFN